MKIHTEACPSPKLNNLQQLLLDLFILYWLCPTTCYAHSLAFSIIIQRLYFHFDGKYIRKGNILKVTDTECLCAMFIVI